MAEQIVTQTGLVDTRGLTGWAALDDTLRKRDEQTAKDHMSDIDTLLVFAGLYSAVLTAFLVESYKNLQEDPQQVVIGLLRQISSQTHNYTLTSTHVNSSTPFVDSSASSFVPRSTDIRVNVCWFASLVFSLSSASFGILVKQWLREYLAIDHVMVPQERARLRYFRTLGLKDWKLFEIAAILPLILQLALALFFAGLCFFTSSVHRSIGTTSVCLVAGWTIFFVLALLAPISSPNCPYKTTFLKTALSSIRIYVLSVIGYVACHPAYRQIGRTLSKLKNNVAHNVRLSLVKIKLIIAQVARTAKWTAATLRPRRQIRESEARHRTAHNSNEGSRSPVIRFHVVKNKVLENEENQICRKNGNDTMILLDVDTMLNDELLVAMQAALHQTPPTLETVLQFAMDVVSHRLIRDDIQQYVFDWRERLDLTALPAVSRNVVMSIVVDGIMATMDNLFDGSLFHLRYHRKFPLIRSACQFLISDGGPITHEVSVLAQRLLDNALLGHCTGINYDSFQESGIMGRFSIFLSNIRDIFLTLDAKHAHAPIKVFFQCYFWGGFERPRDDVLQALLWERLRWDDVRDWGVSSRSLAALVELASTAIWSANNQRRANLQNLTLPPVEVELLGTVLDAISVILAVRPRYNFKQSSLSGAVTPGDVFKVLFNTPETLPQFLETIFTRSDTLSTDPDGPLLRSLICIEFYTWEQYIRAQRDASPGLSLASTLHLTRMTCLARDWWRYEIHRWQKTCEDLVFLIDKASTSSLSNYTGSGEGKQPSLSKEKEIALSILRDMDDPNRDSQPNEHHDRKSPWWMKFEFSKSRYSDDLIQRLLDIAGSDSVFGTAGLMFWRIRRLKDMQNENTGQVTPLHEHGLKSTNVPIDPNMLTHN